MLRRMIAPNADLRCTAVDIMIDPYWSSRVESASHAHSTYPCPSCHASVLIFKLNYPERSASASPSIAFEKDMSKLLDVSLPWPTRSASTKNKDKENVVLVPKDNNENMEPKSDCTAANHARSKSQPKVAAPKGKAFLYNRTPWCVDLDLTTAIQPRRRPAIPPITNLSPVKASPPTSPLSPAFAARNTNENASIASPTKVVARKPQGPRRPVSPLSPNLPQPPANKKVRDVNWRSGVLRDLTGLNNRHVGNPAMVVKEKPRTKTKMKENEANVSLKEEDSVRKRVNEWERERERLREMERLEAFGRERDEELECAREGIRAGHVFLHVFSFVIA